MKPKFKLSKKKWILSAVALVTVGAVGAGIFFGAQTGGETVGVYPFSYMGMTEYWGDSQESYGPVSTDKIQTVFLSDTQTVTEILVQQGDTVKKGDKLLSFDTTLDDLALERKRLAAEKVRLQLQDAESDLARINSLKPMQIPAQTPETEPDYGQELLGDYQISKNTAFDGSTQEKSLICWLKDASSISDSLLNNLWQKALEYQSMNVPEPSSSASAVPTAAPETQAPTTQTQAPTTGSTAEPTGSATEPAFTLIPLKNSDVAIAGISFPYTGSPVTPQVVVTVEGKVLTADTDYTVTYENNVEPGTATVIVRGNETASDTYGYTGEVRIGFAIVTAPETTPETTAPTTEPTTPTTETTDPTTEPTAPTTEPTAPAEPILPSAPTSDFYVIIKITEGNQEKAPLLYWQGLHVFRLENGGFAFQFFRADGIGDHTLTPEEEEEGSDIDFGSGFTAKDIAAMREAAKKKIKELELELKMAEAEYKIMQREVSDGHIYAEVDGEVVSLLDAEEAKSTMQPVIKVSGGGGFYVEGSVNELEKDRLKPGQQVTINDWNTGMTYDGEVVSIGDFPTNENGWNGMGNPNSSYYPFTVFVDGSADLQAGRYVSVTYSTSEGGNGIYLENPFIRTEQGESYVFVLGENGKLEKRTVVTGKSLWGSYTQILSGITEEDFLAFPYGKEVKDGAPAEEKDISELYSY